MDRAHTLHIAMNYRRQREMEIPESKGVYHGAPKRQVMGPAKLSMYTHAITNSQLIMMLIFIIFALICN